MRIQEALNRIERAQLRKPRGLRELTALASDSRPEVRFRVAEKLDGAKSRAARLTLSLLLADPDPLVRVQAIESFGSVAPTEADQRQMLMALNDRSDLVRAYAVDAIRDNALRKYRVRLRSYWTSEASHFQVALGAAELAFGGSGGLRKVLSGLHSRDHQVVCFTANMISTLRLSPLQVGKASKALRKVKPKAGRRSIREAIERALTDLPAVS